MKKTKRFTSKRRFKFKKITTGDPASCWYCNKKTLFALYDLKKGSEIWCCNECALKHGKIKRLVNLVRKYPRRKKKSKKSNVSRVKKVKTSMSAPKQTSLLGADLK